MDSWEKKPNSVTALGQRRRVSQENKEDVHIRSAKAFIVGQNSCFQQCFLASRFQNTLKTKTAFSIQYTMRIFLKSKLSLATSAMQFERIHQNRSETPKLTPVLKRSKKFVKSCKSEQGIGASKLSRSGTVLRLCYPYLVQLAFQCGYLFRIGESDVEPR